MKVTVELEEELNTISRINIYKFLNKISKLFYMYYL